MTDQTETGPARQGSTERCTCGHTKRDHSGRRDHTTKHPSIPLRPWCHACETECTYCPPTADETERRDRYATAIRETDGWVLDDGQHMIDAVMAVADAEQAELRAEVERLWGELHRRDNEDDEPQRPAAAPAVDRAALRDRIARAIHRYDNHHALSGNDMPSEHHYGEADAVLAVLPNTGHAAVRAAALREAADFVGNDDTCDCGGCDSCFPNKLADGLRRLADETPDAETEGARCVCGGRFPINHLHADVHQPAAGARQDGATP